MAEIKNNFKYVWYANMPVYGSRIRLYGDTDADYTKLGIGGVFYDQTKKNFNYNDGINTEITVGERYTNFSYVLVTSEDSKDSEGNYKIESRWFVMDAIKLRNGQHKLKLHRDVVADNYKTVQNSLCYIEKATLDADNPLIYNSEGNILNRIKKSETLLPDKTKMAWIVGYYAKNVSDEYLKGTVNTNDPKDFEFEEISTTLANWTYSQYSASNKAKSNPTKAELKLSANGGSSTTTTGQTIYRRRVVWFNDITDIADGGYSFDNLGSWTILNVPELYFRKDSLSDDYVQEMIDKASQTSLNNALKSDFSINGDFEKMKEYNGKIIKDSEGKYYKCRFISDGTYSFDGDVDSSTELFTYLISWLTSTELFTVATKTGSSYQKKISGYAGYLIFEELSEESYVFDMSGMKAITTDSGYNIFAIPYPIDDISVKRNWVSLMTEKGSLGLEGNLAYFTPTKEHSLAIAQSIATTMGSNLYDIQLLPYCPVQNEVSRDDLYGLKVNSHITFGDKYKSKGTTYSLVGKESSTTEIDKDNLIGIILYATNSRFSFSIDESIKMVGSASSGSDMKVANECDLYRLCSPNYQGNFEFSVAKNGGSVQFFDVDCAYKPYSPYIHIAPNFSGIYGQDFNDARGLTCAGDFSLDIISDAWQQYQINNKNYENIFNRQIENMDFNYGQQRIQKAFSSVTGTLQGGMSGAMAGGMMGGAYGAVAGAVIGTATSAIGAGIDWSMMESAYQEQKQYAYDNFNFRLGNIQALPYSLTKVSSFNPNSKIVPFIEYYTCTDEERSAIERKIRYDGMSVGVLGTISDYAGYAEERNDAKYVKATLVQPTRTYYGDEHMYQEIAKELSMGVYL